MNSYNRQFRSRADTRYSWRQWLLAALMVSCAYATQATTATFECPRGKPATADLGEGVVMYTCLWKNATGEVLRVGPMELVKNDILILQVQTDDNGQLHGQYTSWDDDGNLTESGHYARGQKVGDWVKVDADGSTTTERFENGVRIQP